ncbi:MULTISPECIES: hypothetical protein [unclassified Nocardia]|uniref:hypothetical protein n=1 Tax=unclassified Nocardia TaxID=2637762 RepID=UPI001CE3BEA7|nr:MULTISPECIES: hypothetical protein [unclassified Nocardia]
MKKILAVVIVAAAVFAPVGSAAAEPISAVSAAQPIGASTGSADASLLCNLLKMLQLGFVDSSGRTPGNGTC